MINISLKINGTQIFENIYFYIPSNKGLTIIK